MEGMTKARLRARDEMLFLAWHTAYLTAYAPERSSKFTKLDKLIGRDAEPTGRKMTADQMEETVRGWLGRRKSAVKAPSPIG